MIVEDERLAREELEFLLSQEDDIRLIASLRCGGKLLELVEEHHPDLVFLDIQIPDINGVELAQILNKKKKPPLIIFSTAYQEFAVEAFGLNVVDYLLKPYETGRFKNSMFRVRNILKEKNKLTTTNSFGKLLIEEGNNIILLDPKEIVFAEKVGRHLVIYTETRVITTKMTIVDLENLTRNQAFIKPHRSYLVNEKYIKELRPWINGAYNMFLSNKSETKIPVPRTAIKNLLQQLNGEKGSHI